MKFEINLNTSSLIKARKEYEQKIISAREELINVEKTQYIKCKKCGRKSQIKSLKYSEIFYYEKPHGCIGGDNWYSSGIYLECPKCGNTTKLHKPSNLASEKEKIDYTKFHNLIMNHGIKCEEIYED